MRDYFLKKTEGLHRARSRLIKVNGHWYFKQLTEEEWAERVDNFIQLRDDIKSEEDLNAFL